MRSQSGRVSCCRNRAAPGSAFKVRTPPLGPSAKRTGTAKRAVSGPAISAQRRTKVGSAKPARTKAVWAAVVASGAKADTQFRLRGGCSTSALRVMVGLCMAQRARSKAASPFAHSSCWSGTIFTGATLPWRALPGKVADPYRVWLSEIMLQQTTVQAVAAYYRKFLARWPNVEALAKAPQDEVLAAWAGLGYYARARNLHAAAKVVAGELGGRFPNDRRSVAQIAGHWRLHGRRDCRHRLRRARSGDGRQCRAGDRAAVRRDRAAAGR